MKRAALWPVLCTSLFFFVCSASAALYPYLAPIRAEITNELAIVEATGLDTPQLRSERRRLLQARTIIDRRTRPSLQNDVQRLSLLSTLLARSQNSSDFAPLLDTAVQDYLAVFENAATILATNIAALPPSDEADAAAISLDGVNAMLDRAAAANSPVLATRYLNAAVLRITRLQSFVARVSQEAAGANALHATVNGEPFDADPPVATQYSPVANTLSITANQQVGLESRTITLSLGDVQPGTTTHRLGDIIFGNYGTYSTRGTNAVDFSSVSGFATVTIDLRRNTATGTFSFFGATQGSLGTPVQVNGRFNLPLQ